MKSHSSQPVPLFLIPSGLMRLWGLKKGVESALVGRGTEWLPEQLLYTEGAVGGRVASDETEVESTVN